MKVGRRGATGLGLAVLVTLALGTGAVTPAAADDTTARTYPGPAYSADYPQSPTQAENQSKLWFHAGAWWALLVEPTGKTSRVFELMPDHTWRPTSAVVSTDVGDVGDAVQVGDTVHVLTRSSDGSLFYVRLSFDAANTDYRVDQPRLVTTRKSPAPASIAVDSSGDLWVGYATAVNVVVVPSDDGGRTWGRTLTLASNPDGKVPEVAALVAYDDRVGILWSDHAAGAFRFASHRAGDDPSVWAREVARAGPGEADAHISLARIPGEPSDTLVAAVRTTHDQDGVGNAPLLEVLVRAPGGQWSMAPVSTVADRLDDPSLLVDEATRTLRVFATLDGTVVTKTAPLDAISFAPGSGEPFVNGTGRTLSDPTVPKDPVDAGSGVVVLTSDPENRVYRHAELPLTPPTPVVDPDDHTPPTAPTGLQGRAVDPESVVLSWGAANDGTRWVPGGTGVPVAGYVVTRNGADVATVTTTSFEDRVRAATDATAATSVRYSVVAVDAAGNRSAPATLVVAVPGSVRSLTPLYVAVALLALAVLIGVAYLLYRRRVVRGATIPELPEELSRDEPRTRTPVT